MPSIFTPTVPQALQQLLHAMDVADDVREGRAAWIDAHTAHVAIGVARQQARDALNLHHTAELESEQVHQGGLEVHELNDDGPRPPHEGETLCLSATGAVLA